MPELPEVETVRRCLLPFVEQQTLARIEICDAKLVGRTTNGAQNPDG